MSGPATKTMLHQSQEVQQALDLLYKAETLLREALSGKTKQCPLVGGEALREKAETRIAHFERTAKAMGKRTLRIRLRANMGDHRVHALRELCAQRLWPSDLVVQDDIDSVSMVLCGTNETDAARVAERILAEYSSTYPTLGELTFAVVPPAS